MSNPGIPTIEQLRVFLAVVDTGSFAAAGRQLNRAVSVVSYGISNLEAQLGIRLFDREGTRKPTLTAEGRSLLSDVRTISESIDGLRSKVKGLLDGLEAEVNLAVDVMLPPTRIGAILRAFNNEYPTVSLRLHVEALGGVTALVINKTAIVGISSPVAAEVEGVTCISAGALPMVPVSAPCHPLGRMERIAPGEGRKHIQIVLTDRSPITEGRDYSVLSPRTWRIADLGAKLSLLKEGVGWGNMPLPLIEDDLARGSLKRLHMPDHSGGMYRFAGVWRRDTPPGPAAAWLLNEFVRHGAADVDEPGLPEV